LKVEEGLSMYPTCCTSIFINVPWAYIFKFDPNYLENEEKHKAIKTGILGGGSSDDESISEESESEDNDEGVFRRLIPYILPC